MFISLLQKIVRPIFGDFEREEFKKFIRMGLIFAFIIGSYWTIRVLKNAVFVGLVDKHALPWAKTASILCLFPILMIYTTLLNKYSREKMFYILSAFYGIVTLGFGLGLLSPLFGQAPADVIAAREGIFWFATKFLGYAWYVFVESYGSLLVALFWAFASDVTMPESAKKGFSFVVAIGQMGGIFGPYFISSIPKTFGFESAAAALFVSSITILAVGLLVKYFLMATPANLLVSYEEKVEKKEDEEEPGFLEGLRLLLTHKYLLGIFGVLFFFESIVTIFDFHFQVLAATTYSGADLVAFQGLYGSLVNLVALACLLLGVSNIARYLGIGAALALMPIIVAGALLGFLTLDSLTFLLCLMVGSKAANYALNGPALKQLYIPTSRDAKFKSQAWIETFGSRGSKEAGSLFNMLLKPFANRFGEAAGRLYHVWLGSMIGFAMVVVWFFVALFLGRTYKKAVDEKRVVC